MNGSGFPLACVKFDEKRGTIFNSNKEIVMIAPRVRDVYVLDMHLLNKNLASLPNPLKGKHHRANFKTKQTSSNKKCLHLLHMDLFGPVTPRNSILVNFCDEKGISQNFSSSYTPKQNGVAERKNRTLIEAARTMLSAFVFSNQYWTKAVATACYTQNRSTIVKRHIKTPYESFHGRIPNIDFLYVFGCPVYIHNQIDYLGKFDEKDDDGYFLGYSLVSKAFRVFNTRRQQTEETYHITFDESTDAIKFTKPLVDNITIAESKRYPPDEYLHPYELSQMYQSHLIKHDQTDQNDQTDHSTQAGEILNDDLPEHSNHNNYDPITDNLINTKDVQNPKPTSSPAKDSLISNTIQIPSSSIPSMASPAP
ncbi:retrovirus-related pol polyprotein from transposon TNT 1-94 [Tanacetum coccineum]